ncbi:MAG: hypothetical protein RLZZ175_2865 [Bacteroidota bacterium]|jgi:superfamily II DNA/RNA helicase
MNHQLINTALRNLQIAELNPMQLAVLEAIKTKKDNDLVLLSPTGSGKTLAFMLPLLTFLDAQNTKDVQALILVPSRELALQIEQVWKAMGTGFKINSCYGGHNTKTERNNFQHPPAVLVGTPGRVIYHLEKGSFDPKSINYLVLDEFDKALEFGFQVEMGTIIDTLVNIKKHILTSATQGIDIPPFAQINNPHTLSFISNTISNQLTFKVVHAERQDKLEVLYKLLGTIGTKPTLIFCNHRDAVERISSLLKQNDIPHGQYHGKLEQVDRELALVKFRNGSYNILITTDLASRGLDIPTIEFVVHYQIPTTLETFTHRNGRTARMHAEGTAYMILGEKEFVPAFIEQEPIVETLSSTYILPKQEADFTTLRLSLGKKDKINKIDIVGYLIQKGGLSKEEVGKIEVQDFESYVAVISSKSKELITTLKMEKIKNKSVKIIVI